jgi:hypothetical protein
MSKNKQENIYDVSAYNDKELYDLLDLNSPTDRELEAKVVFMIKKYRNMQNTSGDQLAKFFTDIYNHFFDNDDEEVNDKEEGNAINGVLDPLSPMNLKKEVELDEGFENMQQNSIDTTQLGEQTVNTTALQLQQAGETIKTQKTSNIGFVKPLDYAPDQLNPLLTQTTKRIISIDSQYRDDKTCMPTEFTFNLSSPLKDVVSLKLYSVQIPYTWYTISKSFGSNFFYLKGNTPGILNNENQYMIFDISSGNYNSQDLVNAINTSIIKKQSIYSDVSFGNTKITYNQNTSLASFNIDITKQYSENSYYLQFENYTSPNNYDTSRNMSIPSFLGFNNQTYQLNTINSSFTLTLDVNNIFYTAENFILTDKNNYFTIIKYISNYNSNDKTVDDLNSNSVVDISFNIVLTGLDLGFAYSRNDIFNDLSNQIFNCKYLSNESYIQRLTILDPSNISFGNAYYQMKLKPNRYTTTNLSNSKIFVKFPDEVNIWSSNTSCFRFPDVSNEINTVLAETVAIPQTINYSIVGTPQIIITCSSENFVSPLNNVIIPITPSPSNQPYDLEQYISAINTSIVNTTTTNYFLGGPPSTNYKYIYNKRIVPNYSYSYVDDNDIFNLFLKINKKFDESMYRLDLTNTILNEVLYVGNDFGKTQIVTKNDTIHISGFINNDIFTILSGTMPKVDLNKVDVKLSFDVSGKTFGNQTYYDPINENFLLGNIYLHKNDQDYININNNWLLTGRTYVVTETTYVVTAKRFSVPLDIIGIPSNVIDVSSTDFSISESSIPFTSNFIQIPNNISNIYFNDYKLAVSAPDLIINGNKWSVKGNTWTIDTDNNWTINGNLFLTNDVSWNITTMDFIIENYNNSILTTSVSIKGQKLNLSGNDFVVTGLSSNNLELYYSNVWEAICSSYSISNNINTINTKIFIVDATIETPLIIDSNKLSLNNNKLTMNGSNLIISGIDVIISGNNSNSNNFTAEGDNINLKGKDFNIIGNTITYSGNTINIKEFDIELLPNYIDVSGSIMSISGDNLLTVTKNNYVLTGNLLSVNNNNEFNLQSDVNINSNYFVLEYYSDLHLLKDDITVYGDNMTVTGTSMDINGINWDISCNSLTTFNPNIYQNVDTSQLQESTSITLDNSNNQPINTNDLINSTTSTITSSGYRNYNYSINSTVSNDIQFKGNNIIIPNNNNTINTVYLNYRSPNKVSLDVSGTVLSNSLQIVSEKNGMQIDMIECNIHSSDLTYIRTTGLDGGNSFTLDISNILVNNTTNYFTFYSNILQYSSITNIPSFSNNNWELSGNQLTLFTNSIITINNQTYTNNELGVIGYVIGDGLMSITNNVTYQTINIKNLNGDITTYSFSGNLDSIKGRNMYLNAKGNENIFDINIGPFNLKGNTILIDNNLNSQSSEVGYISFQQNYNYNSFQIPGNTIRSPDNNIYLVTCRNNNINYDLSATNMVMTGDNLSISKRILNIYGNIYAEPTKSINITSSTYMNVNNIFYLRGHRTSVQGLVTTTGNHISVAKDTISKLYNSYASSSNIYIRGNTTNFTDNKLSLRGIVSVNNINNSNFITTFSTNDYPNDSLKLSSRLFNIINNDIEDIFQVSSENINFYGNNWNSYGNSLIIYEKFGATNNNDWTINATGLYVQDQSFNILENSVTLPSSDIYVPGHSLKISGNNITIPGNIFSSGSEEINLITPINASKSLLDISTKVYNIYDDEFKLPGNTISSNTNNDGSMTWTAIGKKGFKLDPNTIINQSANTDLIGNNIEISSDGNSSFLISASPLSLELSANQYTIGNDGNITFIGKTYTYNNIPINLGTNLIPYDFSINVVYNDTYLPMTTLSSNSNYLSSYVIPNESVLLKIYPRFSPPINVFGNEYDISYTIFNNTGNDIVCNNLNILQSSIISLFESFTDKNGIHILSGSKIITALNQTDPNNTTVDTTINLVFNKQLGNSDYAIEFANYTDTSKKQYESWKANFFIDPSFVDMSYGLINNYKKESIVANNYINYLTIKGTTVVQTINIILKDNINNILTLVAYEDGTILNNVKITIPVYSNGSEIIYSRDGLIKTINSLLSNTIAAGTNFSIIVKNGLTYVQMKSNINLIYRSNNYNVVFYDTISFVSCYSGTKSVRNTTWDTTVGWILGFRNNSVYDLSQYELQSSGTNIIGDTGVCTNLFNYFLLCIDDFTQNHLNDGLITITSTEKSIPLPSYANRTNFICDPATKSLTYNNLNTTEYSKLTQNQIYSITQIANSQNTNTSNLTNGVSSSSFGSGPYVQDIFGLIPMKVAGLSVGSTYVEFGGTLQNQERVYFGPVNIHRMSVKLVTDRGDVVDLNEVNWSFSLLCEQLYKPRPST